jgi:hypothetical protein
MLPAGQCVAFRDPPTGNRQQLGIMPDPRLFFGSKDRKWWDNVRSRVEVLRSKQPGDLVSKVRSATTVYRDIRDGRTLLRIDIQTSSKNGERHANSKVFDSAKACLILDAIFKDSVDGRLLQYDAFEYDSVGSVNIPTKIVQYISDFGTGAPRFRRELKSQEQKVNDPIPMDTFSYRGLGLKDGDLLMDRIENVAFTIVGNERVKLANFGERVTVPIMADEGNQFRWLFVLFNVAVVFILVFALLRKRGRTANQMSP